MWGGVECTHNRVGDEYIDQLGYSGHDRRIEDLDLFAELGLRALRYPVLWERTAPNGPERADWSWPDQRLAGLRERGIRPIVGLVHHGSGPRHTSLVDPRFPEGLAAFAGAVAARYPWVEDYTPVNEPLTTARFSGLYGHWYPHGQDDRTFIRTLLIQCRAVVEAMGAIRAVNPHARLVQTDDLGKTWSTPTLAYQAELENHRRWLSFDMLCGRVTHDHPLWKYLLKFGASEAELRWFEEHPCPPDIAGINHYLSGERFLDERGELYPGETLGGNERHRYVDVLALRVRSAGVAGPQALLREAWERYRIPLAVTEAHNGCTREEQLRWLLEVWDAALALQGEGVDIRAVTAWSLLGAYDWDTLVTRAAGCYEPGVFDLRAPQPRPTAIAGLIRELAAGRRPDHPLYAVPGWWHRPDRFTYGMALDDAANVRPAVEAPPEPQPGVPTRPILITGATGRLGQAFARICAERGLPYQALSQQELDIADPAAVTATLDALEPWAVVNAAGYANVDDAEQEPEMCYRANAHGPALLAAACAERGSALVTFSTDLVFDGRRQTPYLEHDRVAPLNSYGASKVAAEERVPRALPEALVVRAGPCFGPWDERNFVLAALRSLAAGARFVAANDMVISPTYTPDLVQTCLDLLIDGERGVWHLANPGDLTWAELARAAAEAASLDPAGVRGRPLHALGLRALRPRYSALGSARGVLLPALDNALARYLEAATANGLLDPRPELDLAPSIPRRVKARAYAA
jgi:dTDP-4-dehydrorhamnose reductase